MFKGKGGLVMEPRGYLLILEIYVLILAYIYFRRH